MYSKTFLLVALVLVLAMGMGCGGGSSIHDQRRETLPLTVVGTWNRADSNTTFPNQIVFNANGTGTYIFSNFKANSSITWTSSGDQITIYHGNYPNRHYYSDLHLTILSR